MNLDLIGGYQKIITIILLILSGYFFKKRGLITSGYQSALTNMLIKIIIPFSIFSSFFSPFNMRKMNTSIILIVVALVFYPLSQFVITRFIYRRYPKGEEKQRLFRFATTYSNAMFMGYPFSSALFGQEGLFFASVFNLPFTVYIWSMGYAYLTSQPLNLKGLTNTLKNPAITACLFGYIWWLFYPLLPTGAGLVLSPVLNVFETIGVCTTPLSMMVIGTLLADTKLSDMVSNPEIWFFSFVKLFIMPLIIYTALYATGFRSWELAIPVLIIAMPTSAVGGILAAEYGIAKGMAASLITSSTALSAISLIFWLMLILKTAT